MEYIRDKLNRVTKMIINIFLKSTCSFLVIYIVIEMIKNQIR